MCVDLVVRNRRRSANRWRWLFIEFPEEWAIQHYWNHMMRSRFVPTRWFHELSGIVSCGWSGSTSAKALLPPHGSLLASTIILQPFWITFSDETYVLCVTWGENRTTRLYLIQYASRRPTDIFWLSLYWNCYDFIWIMKSFAFRALIWGPPPFV